MRYYISAKVVANRHRYAFECACGCGTEVSLSLRVCVCHLIAMPSWTKPSYKFGLCLGYKASTDRNGAGRNLVPPMWQNPVLATARLAGLQGMSPLQCMQSRQARESPLCAGALECDEHSGAQ